MAWYDGDILQGFKWSRSNLKGHSGDDIAAPIGTNITATMPGTVVSKGMEPWGGQTNELVWVGGAPYVMSWLHESALPEAAPGSHVNVGQSMGLSGEPPPGAGYGSGAHIHFEISHGSLPPYMSSYGPTHPTADNYPVDPSSWLSLWRSHGGGPSGPPQPPGQSSNTCDMAAWEQCLKGCQTVPDAQKGQCIMDCFNRYGCQAPIDPSNPLPDVAQAISNLEVGAAEALKRIGLFVLAMLAVVIGAYLMFKPQVDQAVKTGLKSGVKAGLKAAVL